MSTEILPRMVPVRDRRTVLVRALAPDDGESLGKMFAALSARTEHFFHPFPLTVEAGGLFAGRTDVQAVIALDPLDRAVIGLAWTDSASPPSFGICVRDDWQGHGLGGPLAATVLALTRAAGAPAVQLTVLEANPARTLYEKLGFVVDGEASDAFGPSLHMTLHFGGPGGLPGIVETADDVRRELAGAEILVVPYCHADWAWTHTRQWHALRYNEVINDVLDILDSQDRQGIVPDAPNAFRWYLDTVAMELEPFLARSPERLLELRRRVREGRIAVCGGFVNVRPNMVGDETFLRSLQIGRREFRALFPGVALDVFADTVDVAVGHPQMPQVLRLAGFRGYRFWRPQTGLNLKGVPFEFSWRGLDGSEVLCSRGCYGGVISTRLLPEGYSQDWDKTVRTWWDLEIANRALLSPAALPVLYHGMDDARPLRTNFHEDAPLDLPAFIEEWNRREVAPMRFATPNELLEALETRRDRLPLHCGVLDPCEVCYNMAWNGSRGLWRLRVLGDAALTTAERWRSLARQTGCTYPVADLDRLWRELLRVSAHAVQWLFAADYREMRERALQVISEADRLRTEGQQALVRATLPPALPDRLHPSMAVFNSVPWKRQALVRLHLAFPEGAPAACRIEDQTGQKLPWQIFKQYDHAGKTWEWDVEALVPLPPHGTNAVSVRTAGADPVPTPFREKRIRGGNAELPGKLSAHFRDKRLSTVHAEDETALRATEAGEIGALRLYEVDPAGPLHVGDILSVHDVRWSSARWVHRGCLRNTLRRTGRVGPHKVEVDVSTFPEDARIEWRVAVDWVAWNGFLAIEFPVPVPCELHGDIPFGVQRIDLDTEPYGPVPVRGWDNIERQRKGLFFARSFVTAIGPETSLSLISHDGDRYYRWDAERKMLEHVLINSFQKPPTGWEQHINDGVGGRGRHEFHCSLLAHSGDWRAAGTVRRAAELRTPPEVFEVFPQEPDHESTGAPVGIAIEPENVSLTALYDDGAGTLLRLCETWGAPITAEVRLPGVRGAEMVDLHGAPLPDREGMAKLVDGVVHVPLRPWEICILRLDMTGTGHEPRQ